MLAEKMIYNIFTTGYSNQMIWYKVDEEHHEISSQVTSEIEPNLSFGAVDEVNSCIYFVHEVGKYGNFSNNGAVSRYTVVKEKKQNLNIPILTQEEVCKYN